MPRAAHQEANVVRLKRLGIDALREQWADPAGVAAEPPSAGADADAGAPPAATPVN